MDNFETDYKLIQMLLTRLERISVDSYWAHRAGGIRGSLIKLVGKMDAGVFPPHKEALELMGMGFMILEQAALKKEGTNLSALVHSNEQKQGIKMFLDHIDYK